MRRMPSRDATRNLLARKSPDEEAWQPAAGNQAARDDWSALMARSQEGDQRAYHVLLKSITPYLRTLARRGGLAADEIEDGVQDVLLTVHAIRHTYDPMRPFAPWLAAIAHHRLVHRTPRRILISARETELTDAHETLATEETNSRARPSDAPRLRLPLSPPPHCHRHPFQSLR